MCWSEGASLAMTGVGAVAAVVTWRRGDPPAIPAALAFFAVMEGLQYWGYQGIDQCDLPGNRTPAMPSYVHIALQPIFINAFGMAIIGGVSARLWRLVMGLSVLASILLLFRMVPMASIGPCLPGTTLCGPAWFTIPCSATTVVPASARSWPPCCPTASPSCCAGRRCSAYGSSSIGPSGPAPRLPCPRGPALGGGAATGQVDKGIGEAVVAFPGGAEAPALLKNAAGKGRKKGVPLRRPMDLCEVEAIGQG